MAARFLSLFKVFRRKSKKDTAAAPPQQPGDVEQFQPLQEGTDQTQQQDSALSRFRKTAQTFRKFMGIRRRKTKTTTTEGTAEPDSRLTELPTEADVSTASAEHSENSDMAMNDQRAKADTAQTEDRAVTKDIALTKDMAPTEDTALTEHMAPIEDMATTKDLALIKDLALTKDMALTGDMAPPNNMAIANTDTGKTQGIANANTMPTPTVIHAPILDLFEESGVSSQQQVPAIVRSIHQRLMSCYIVDDTLRSNILRLAEEHPVDVVMTLLRCAPSCDRAAAMMWKTIASSGPTVGKVLPTLLCVMEDWPVHSMSTSDGDNKDVFALAATLALWVIVLAPACQETMIIYSSRLFVALLFQVVVTTEQMPEEVHNFWRTCREEYNCYTDPNSFAVQTMRALLWRLCCDDVVMAMEHKYGWDTLLCADTQHYAVGHLAREMHRVLVPLCHRIALHLLRLLSREEPHWDLPALAFLVEVLDCLDLTECGDSVLEILTKRLHSQCGQRRRLALRGFVMLSNDPIMARRMGIVSLRLVELLADRDGEVVEMTLSVFTNVLQKKDILVSSTTAPKLAEALLPLFDHDYYHVQLLSIRLFGKVMESVAEEGKEALKTIVDRSLYPLFIYCLNENRLVAEASHQTLLRAASFLKRRDLQKLLKANKMVKVAECLLAEGREPSGRAAAPRPAVPGEPGEAPARGGRQVPGERRAVPGGGGAAACRETQQQETEDTT